MKINDKGLELIKRFEGCRLTAYRCPAGVWTIGYGHTQDVKPGMAITKYDAERFLRQDIRRFEEGVTALVKVPLTSNQFSALVSFAFNVGVSALKSSTLLKKLNRGDLNGAANEFLRWNKAGGKELEGLTKRREAERNLFLLIDKDDYLDSRL